MTGTDPAGAVTGTDPAGAVTVAWVDGEPVGRAEVDDHLRGLYAGSTGARLPGPDTAEGRQLRRWVVQVLAVTAVLAHEARARGLPASEPVPYPDRSELGGIAVAALARSPYARAVFDAVTAAVQVTEDEVRACRAANPEFDGEEVRLVRHVRDGRPVNGGRPYRVRRDDLLGDRVFAAAPGTALRSGPDTLEVVGVARDGGRDVAATLLRAARERAFARWLDVQLRDRVVLAPGAEHPGDPAQPDHTHRH